jgi:tRNA G46 methylase TrmB
MLVLAAVLAPGGRLVVQTDVYDLAVDMRSVARGSPCFTDSRDDEEDWFTEVGEVFPVSTEWQAVRAKQGLPVYRFVLTRSNVT